MAVILSMHRIILVLALWLVQERQPFLLCYYVYMYTLYTSRTHDVSNNQFHQALTSHLIGIEYL